VVIKTLSTCHGTVKQPWTQHEPFAHNSVQIAVTLCSYIVQILLKQDYNCSVEFFWSPFLVNLETKSNGTRDSLRQPSREEWKGRDGRRGSLPQCAEHGLLPESHLNTNGTTTFLKYCCRLVYFKLADDNISRGVHVLQHYGNTHNTYIYRLHE
jgi:hypothetical protein